MKHQLPISQNKRNFLQNATKSERIHQSVLMKKNLSLFLFGWYGQPRDGHNFLFLLFFSKGEKKKRKKRRRNNTWWKVKNSNHLLDQKTIWQLQRRVSSQWTAYVRQWLLLLHLAASSLNGTKQRLFLFKQLYNQLTTHLAFRREEITFSPSNTISLTNISWTKPKWQPKWGERRWPFHNQRTFCSLKTSLQLKSTHIPR